MSNTKTVMSQAANTLTTPLNVEDVFSTYLYDGNGSTQTITNGIDLDGEGGLVWLKNRDGAFDHHVYDTERGVTEKLIPNKTNAESTDTSGITAFNSNGFIIGAHPAVNTNGNSIASWTFRKAPKFFDVVTYTGNGTAGREISHNLGTTVGCVMIKNLSSAENWMVYHRGSTGTDGIDGQLNLNSTAAATDDSSQFNDTVPSSTVLTLGSNAEVNFNGDNYVAYLFAHNDGDGGFNGGDIIKCGSYTGNGSSDGPEIDLGFEPQWIMFKRTTGVENWIMFDNMRGMVVGGIDPDLRPDLSQAEGAFVNYLEPNPTGFKLTNANSRTNGTGDNYIYIAIRRGTKVPESATEVFHTQLQSNGDTYSVGFPNDLLLLNKTGGSSANTYVGSRLTGDDKYLVTSSTAAEGTSSGLWSFDLQDSFDQGASTASPWVGYHWKRAPGYFDAVAYTGNGTAGRTVSHNLGVAPEMMWVKRRSGVEGWQVYHSDLGATKHLELNRNFTATSGSNRWNSTEPTSTEFTVSDIAHLNASGDTYIAYLFASLPGISKVGSYTGDGTSNSSKVIDCGFTSGARFVLIKAATGEANNWFVFDTVRGIVSGFDPRIFLNLTSAEATNADYIDPHNSGFIVGVASNTVNSVNVSGVTYIFYAIA